jgi:hypothetical protein
MFRRFVIESTRLYILICTSCVPLTPHNWTSPSGSVHCGSRASFRAPLVPHPHPNKTFEPTTLRATPLTTSRVPKAPTPDRTDLIRDQSDRAKYTHNSQATCAPGCCHNKNTRKRTLRPTRGTTTTNHTQDVCALSDSYASTQNVDTQLSTAAWIATSHQRTTTVVAPATVYCSTQIADTHLTSHH